MTHEAKEMRQAWWLSVALVVIGALGVLVSLFGVAHAGEPGDSIRGQAISWGLDILGPVVAALAGWALLKVGAWLKTKTQNEQARALIDLAARSAGTAVRAVEATLRPTLKAAASNGKLTPNEGAALRVAALKAMKSDMGPAAAELLQKSLQLGRDEFDGWLGRQVEAANLTLSSKDLGLR